MSLNRVTSGARPTVCVTFQDPARATDRELGERRRSAYLDALTAAGAEPLAIDASLDAQARRTAFSVMDGLLLSGGVDLDPVLYGEQHAGSVDVEPERDQLELEAWTAARARNVPILGICRGFQAVNVFSGGRLVQHVDGHRGAAYPASDPKMHPLRLRPGSRLARILHPTDPTGGVLRVNSFHHQAVRPDGLAPGLLASGVTPHPDGDLVEALESSDPDDFLLAVQCHPERTESTPPQFRRLWTVFVDACRGSARGDRVG